MKKKAQLSKLSISKSVIANLNQKEIASIKGGSVYCNLSGEETCQLACQVATLSTCNGTGCLVATATTTAL